MILSERELQLGEDHSGIMVLAESVEPGTPLATCSRSRRRSSR